MCINTCPFPISGTGGTQSVTVLHYRDFYEDQDFVKPSRLVVKLCQKAERFIRGKLDSGDKKNWDISRSTIQVLRLFDVESAWSRYAEASDHGLHRMTVFQFHDMGKRILTRFLKIRINWVLKLQTIEEVGVSDANRKKRSIIFHGK